VEFIRNLAKIHRLQITVKKLPDGPRAFLMGNVIYLDESLPPERRNFAFCHELAHKLLNHHLQGILSEEMENEANRLAADLLLPPETFRKDALAFPLDQLKQLYPQASWEVIARAKLSLVPALLTIFDNGKQRLRNAHETVQFLPQLLPVELEVYRQCLTHRKHCESQEGIVNSKGYFVDTGQGVLRVLLWTEFDD
jgi:hypothetical protein